ncbi:MAG: hypothetical protein WBB28_20890 [Crinalium sp.]
MKLRNIVLISAVTALTCSVAGSKFSWDVSSWQCNLTSPGARQVCQFQSLPALTRGAQSGFVIGAVLGIGGCIFWGRRRYISETGYIAPTQPEDFNWDYLSAAIAGFVGLIALSEPVKHKVAKVVDLNFTPTPVALKELFTAERSMGNVAICTAEGNCEADGSGKYSQLYHQGGHSDPANNVFNRGFCSDQSNAPSMEEGNRRCVTRISGRVGIITKKFKAENLDPEKHSEAFINGIDQWNQASPRVSDRFPSEYRKALQKNLPIPLAIENARVEAFRNKSGELDASGLRKVCMRWNPSLQQQTGISGLSANSEGFMSRCIGYDQSRRARAIRATIKNYK